jgi:hypothetical protein
MARFRELAEQVRAELPSREVILDGEIVAIDDEGRINFWGSDAETRDAGTAPGTVLCSILSGPPWNRR